MAHKQRVAEPPLIDNQLLLDSRIYIWVQRGFHLEDSCVPELGAKIDEKAIE